MPKQNTIKTMKHVFLTTTIIFTLTLISFSQKTTERNTAKTSDSIIQWRKLKIKTIPEINQQNDSIIDTVTKPDMSVSKLVFRVGSSPSLLNNISDEQSDYSAMQVKEYITDRKITDNHLRYKHLAIINENGKYVVREFLTEIGYYFEEGGGVRKRIAIVEPTAIKQKDILLMFNENYNFPQRKLDVIEIKAQNNELILPENEILYKTASENISFKYCSISCQGSFDFKGRASILPTYINVQLIVTDFKTGNQQEIYKLPDTFSKGLRKMMLCDINGDKHQDIILEVEDELSGHRLLFLSKPKDSKALYDYVGIMEVFRDDP